MYDFRIFDEVFQFDPNYTYDEEDVRDIERSRKELEGLFIDKVLKLLDIKRPAKHYPPKSNNALRELHQLVLKSNGPDHAKLSALFYLLLDNGDQDQAAAEAEKFAEQASLPLKNRIFMRGLWYMDNQEFESALEFLTHPSLLPTFQEEILELLVRRAAQNDYTLALAYYHTVQPVITNAETLDSLFMAIARTSVTEAFYFSRSQADIPRQMMLESLVSHVLQAPANDKTADRAVELINLPFSAEEEAWFEDCLTTGSGRQYKKAKDTLMMRRIATARYSEALSLDGLEGKPINGLSWRTVQNGLTKGLGPRLDLV